MISQNASTQKDSKRGRPPRHRDYSHPREIIPEALKVYQGTRGFRDRVRAFIGCFATGADAALALHDYSGLEISEGLLRKVASGQGDSRLVRKAFKGPQKHIRIRPECSAAQAQRILELIADDPSLEDYSERLKRQVAKVQP